MRILFVQVPTSHLGAREKVYPLGLARLTGMVSYPHEIEGLDMNLAPDPWPALQNKVLSFEPDLCLLSFRNIDPLAGHHASYLSSLKTAAALIRTSLPETRILGGGPAFSLFPHRLMQEIPALDAGVIGEGEPAMAGLLKSGCDFHILPGLIRRVSNHLVLNPSAAPVDMDALPALNTGLFDPRDYLKSNAYVAAVGIEGKRGCDLSCGYCVYPTIGGRHLRVRSPNRIVNEMAYLHRAHGISLFHFTDGVVNRPAGHLEALCREILRRGLKVSWTGFFREDLLSVPLLSLAQNAGLVAVYFSADALTRQGLALLGKQLSMDQIFSASRITAECGMLTMCHFIVNLPGENDASARESMENIDKLLEIHSPAGNLGAVIFNTARLYPGAPLTRRLVRNGFLSPDTDLLYPVYHNPPAHASLLHTLDAHCHAAGVFSRLNLTI